MRPHNDPRSRGLYREHDTIAIPQAIPQLGVSPGDTGLVTGLELRRNTVVAAVRVDYSTGQPRGWVEMEVRPREEVISYSSA